MANVAVADRLPSTPFQFAAAKKRKTPSELRGEQLKRKNDGGAKEPVHPFPGSDGNIFGMDKGHKKSEPSKTPKYIDTRVSDVFPVKKSSTMFRLLSEKEKAKAPLSSNDKISRESNTSANEFEPTCEKSEAHNGENSGARMEIKPGQTSHNMEKCSQITFRTVAELSSKRENLPELSLVDMDKALKGLVVRDLLITPNSSSDPLRRVGGLLSTSLGIACNDILVPSNKTPLDLTLKATLRLVSSSSVSWCHKLSSDAALIAKANFAFQFGLAQDGSTGTSLPVRPTAEVLYSRALYSWVYPQASLPSSVISAMTLSASRGETDFLAKRQLAWEDSFRSLYYLLRKKMCNIFYLCTSQFIIMFIGGNCGQTKHSCSAYLSKSTRGLRSMLREQDIGFSMPLCPSEVEQATIEDLVELSEIEKFNLGEIRRLDSMSNVDNSPQSLLAFLGNKSVHGLYNFLLNYRSFLSSLTITDVPQLYSPIPFENGSLSSPEVKCKEMKRADSVLPPRHQAENGDLNQDPSRAVSYSLEIKGTIIPPWTVSGLCAAMCSQDRSFEASFVAETVSAGLNVALDALCNTKEPVYDPSKGFEESSNALGIPETVVAPGLRSAFLKSLKYSNGSYKASLTPI